MVLTRSTGRVSACLGLISCAQLRQVPHTCTGDEDKLGYTGNTGTMELPTNITTMEVVVNVQAYPSNTAEGAQGPDRSIEMLKMPPSKVRFR